MNNQDWKPEDNMLEGIIAFAGLTVAWMLLALLEPFVAAFFSFCQ